MKNNLTFKLPALPENTDVCVAMVSKFVSLINPTVEELGDIRCSVNEAFDNCVKHAYKHIPDNKNGFVYVSVRLYERREVTVEISDNGCGFKMETKTTPNIGLMAMNVFMDDVKIKSKVGKGTTILMRKQLGEGLLDENH